MTTTAIREQADRLLVQLEEAKQELEGLEFTPAKPPAPFPWLVLGLGVGLGAAVVAIAWVVW
jgi:hypothetical protein